MRPENSIPAGACNLAIIPRIEGVVFLARSVGLNLHLEGRRVVVIGAGRSIGRAIAEAFAAEGASVAICARSADQVTEVVQSLAAGGSKAFGAPVDVRETSQVEAFIATVADKFGGIDILVSNASAMAFAGGEEDWRAMLEVDLLGAVRSFDAAQNFLLASAAQHGDAAFVIISSASAIETNGPGAYGAIKAALIHYAKGIAREQAPKGVRCNVVSPGMVFTEEGAWGRVKVEKPELFAEMLGRNPMGRMATADEIAASVVFLASPRSSYTSGAHLVVDGAKPARVNF